MPRNAQSRTACWIHVAAVIHCCLLARIMPATQTNMPMSEASQRLIKKDHYMTRPCSPSKATDGTFWWPKHQRTTICIEKAPILSLQMALNSFQGNLHVELADIRMSWTYRATSCSASSSVFGCKMQPAPLKPTPADALQHKLCMLPSSARLVLNAPRLGQTPWQACHPERPQQLQPVQSWPLQL